MRISTRTFGDVVVLDLHGNITMYEDGVLLISSVSPLLAEGRRKFVLNIEEVSYIDSAGLGNLVQVYTLIRKEKGTLLLSHPFPRVLDLFSITKLRTVYEVLPSVIDAIAVFEKRDGVTALFATVCPACQQPGSKRFSLWDFFDTKECFSCGVTFRVIKPADALVDVATQTTARLWSMSLPTYQGENVHVSSEKVWMISAPERFDLFSVEVLEKAWFLIPEPRRVVLDVSRVMEFTDRAVVRLLELSDDTRGVDRSIYFTQRDERRPPSPVAAGLKHTNRAYDVAAQKKLKTLPWSETPAIIPVVIIRIGGAGDLP